MRPVSLGIAVMFEKQREGVNTGLYPLSAYQALPDDPHAPSRRLQRFDFCPVAHYVPADFLAPERLACLRRFEKVAIVTVPEAAIYKYGDTIPRKDNIRLTRQVLAMKAETIPPRVEATPDNHLRLGILAADTSHHLAAFGL